MRSLVYLKNVVTLELTDERCNGCGMCVNVCPHQVFTLIDGKAVIFARDYCMECGACARNCPMAAIFVRSGVGCAAALLQGALKNTEPTCGCAEKADCCC